MRLKKFFSILLCLVLISGCSQNSINSDEESTEITSAEVTTQALSPVKGGTLRLCMGKPDTLNPLKNQDVTVDNILKLIYEPLFNIDNNMSIQPNIAESYEISGSTLTVRVKDNIYWQDGKAIGADDVIYSLDEIKSADANSIYKGCLLNVSSYEQTGDKTLNIYYKAPVAAAAYNLTFPVIPKHYFKSQKEADMKPMGSGSFAYDSYGKDIRLKAAKGINGEPYISEISVVIIGDEDTRLNALENNVIDAYCLNAENLGEINSSITSNAKLCPSNQFEYIGFNTGRKIFSTADLRRAMVNIMPMDNIIKGVYVGNITQSITPINPDNSYTDTKGVDTYGTDTSTANTLILASGLTKGDFSFKILVNEENSLRLKSASMINEAFRDFGFNTQVEAVSFEEYTSRLGSGDFDMYLAGTELSPNMNVSALVGTNGAINFTGYANEQMDGYIAAVNASVDFESYRTSLNELNKFLSYELPVAGIGFKKSALVYSDRVHGDITPIFNNYYYSINKWFIAE